MKNILTLLFIVFGMTSIWSQEEKCPEYTGDNFSLEGALAMFKKANSLKNFERIINDKKNNVNNLDLNDDGDIDFVNVEDIKNGNTHVIVLSTFLNETEKQDIATIAIEKTGEAEAVIQIEGDNDLYAENTIIEPTEEKKILKDSNGGPNTPVIEVQTLFVNVWLWPCVHYIYAPKYVVWVSPYRWNYRPNWWRPWHPFVYNIFYVRCSPHRLLYHSVGTRRIFSAKTVYTPVRHSSSLVIHNKRGTTVFKEKARGLKVKNVPLKRIPTRNAPIRKGVVRGVRIKGSMRR